MALLESVSDADLTFFVLCPKGARLHFKDDSKSVVLITALVCADSDGSLTVARML